MKRLVPLLAAALIILSAFAIAGCSIRMETYTGFHLNTYVELSACGLIPPMENGLSWTRTRFICLSWA